MINFHELKEGDLVRCEYNGNTLDGEVTGLNADDKQIRIKTDVQEFWYDPQDVFPIPLDDNQLMKLHFEKHDNPDQTVKYLRGPLRILLPEKGQFSSFEMWYREDKRHMNHPVSVHELQNLYRDMTKVELTRD